ncbi:polar growth protein, partial [Ascosphaera atra]
MHAHEHEHEHDLDAEPEPETESETELEPDADDGQPMYPTAAAPPPTIATRPQTQDSSHRPSSQQQQQHVLRHQPGFINDSGSEYSAAMSSPTRRGYPTATAPDSGASAVMQPQYHHYNTSAVRPSTASSNSTAQSRSHSRSHWFPPQSQYSPSPTHSPTQSHQAPSHTHNRSQSGVPALTPNIVRTWPPSVVAAHLTSIGVDPQHAAVLEEQEITGDVLLEMEQSTMFMKEFNLGTMGRRLKTWYRIKAFQE